MRANFHKRSSILVSFLAVLLFGGVPAFLSLPPYAAADDGRIRALHERAVTITRLKNDFVIRVLEQYGVPFQVNAQKYVVRIKVEQGWDNVKQIDIVPLLQEEDGFVQVTAHEIFFHTDSGIFHLVSSLLIKRPD